MASSPVRRILASCILVTALAAPVAAHAQAAPERVRVDQVTTLRSAPSQGAKAVGWLRSGETATVVERKGRWARIRTDGGTAGSTEGWIFSELLRAADGAAATPPVTRTPRAAPPAQSATSGIAAPAPATPPVAGERGEISGNQVTLRAGPGRHHQALGWMKSGETVMVLGREEQWLRVERSGVPAGRATGWVAAELVRIQPRAAPVVDPVPVAGRFLVLVQSPLADIHEAPSADSTLLSRAETGTQLEADAQLGDWYRVRRPSGGTGWIRQVRDPAGDALGVTAPAEGQRLAYEAGRLDPRAPASLKPAAPPSSGGPVAGDAAATPVPSADAAAPVPASDAPAAPPVVAAAPATTPEAKPDEDGGIDRRRPAGSVIEPRLPVIDPSQVPPPMPFVRRESLPVPDRWRIVQSLGILPYNKADPYNPNPLKGDLPLFQEYLGPDWFFNFSAISDTLFEGRRLPVPVGAQSALNPRSLGTFGNGRQETLAETLILSFGLIKGDTVFRPPDYEFRFVPVVNVNRTAVQEVRLTNIVPTTGPDRNDNFIGVQELFFDKHLRDVSVRYDFDSLRVGIQPFASDFRGFLFTDQPLGVRLFGTRDNNFWQYNLAWFRRLEKDTNSGLNDVNKRLRNDDVYVFNLYRQDFPVLGFTTQGIVLHNRNREGGTNQYYNENGILERPAIFGTGRPHEYKVTYLGLNGEGHFGRWNVSASGYYALGDDSRGMFSGRSERIGAAFGALEVSRDFDWIRVRGSAAYASGDRDPFDGKAEGFDAVLENPLFAGADTSYWIRQSVPLVGGGGTSLSMRNGLLANLRTSREHGQSNFTNPGLRLLGIGADFDVTPQVRVITNVNKLAFDNLSSLATLRNQRLSSGDIGYDVSVGIQYRPLFIQNVVLNASLAVLFPGQGLRELYGNALDAKQYSGLINLLLTY
jgi:uncharacterized protein YgiM (DUF1202 family)